MLGRFGVVSWVLLLLLASGAGCSAVISPDPARLGGDAGPTGSGGGRDAGPTGLDAGPGGCGAGLLACGGACVQPATDPQHCGGCTTVCATGRSCISGICTGGGGVVLGNPTDCGPSHATCGSLEVCVSGGCVCRPPYTSVGGRCVDLATDPQNCGAPGNTCQGNCAAGTCIGGGCPTGTTSCEGACVDLRRDPGNCGDCGRACRAGEVCVGECRRATIPTGCTSCPCASCDGAQCCSYPRLGVPICVNADTCP